MTMDSDEEQQMSDKMTEMLLQQQRQTPSERRELRVKYAHLIESAQKKNESGEFNVRDMVESMDEANVLFEQVSSTREAMYDAKLINIHGEMVKKKAHSIQAGSPFNSTDFLKKLGHQLNCGVDFNRDSWTELGNTVFKMYNRTPRFSFLQGTLQEPTETASRQQRLKVTDHKTKETIVPQVAVQVQNRKANTDKTFEEIKHIKKELCRLYIEKGAPICYFTFSIDPESFARTVENMFHLSFLIKEREAILSLDSNGLPVLKPVLGGGKESSTANCEASQSVLTISVEKWKKLIDTFKIRNAAIRPHASKRRSQSTEGNKKT